MEPVRTLTEAPNTSSVPTPTPHAERGWMYAILAIAVLGSLAWWLVPKLASVPKVAVPGGGVTVSATSSTATVSVGQQITVNIMLDTGMLSVSAADLVVHYDAARLKAVGIKPGGFLPLELAGGSAENGTAAITVASGTSPVSGSGSVLILTFEALTPGQTVVEPATDTKVAAVGQNGNVVGHLAPVTITIQ